MHLQIPTLTFGELCKGKPIKISCQVWQAFEAFTFPGIFHMESIWNRWIPSPFHGIPWTIFWLATQPFFHSMPLWNSDGMSMEWCIPYGFHGLVHVDSMEFPMNLYYKSMYYSIRILWNSMERNHSMCCKI
jgi:hypothetical protein